MERLMAHLLHEVFYLFDEFFDPWVMEGVVAVEIDKVTKLEHILFWELFICLSYVLVFTLWLYLIRHLPSLEPMLLQLSLWEAVESQSICWIGDVTVVDVLANLDWCLSKVVAIMFELSENLLLEEVIFGEHDSSVLVLSVQKCFKLGLGWFM